MRYGARKAGAFPWIAWRRVRSCLLSRIAMSAAVHSPQKFVSLVRTSGLGWRSYVHDGFRSCCNRPIDFSYR